MQRAFGEYLLDETARTLTLRGQPVAVQPLVFDLLAYLAQNAGRVVPKHELLDALWPGVHVTEASLQRAVSLARAALRPGGMAGTIRNYARFGYRFATDAPGTAPLAPPVPAAAEDRAAAARARLERRDWSGAAEAFAALDAAAPLDADALDLWALALECNGRPDAAIGPLARAAAQHAAAGRRSRAAHAAVRLARIHFDRGEAAPVRGWLERAEAMLAGETAGETRALLVWMRSRLVEFDGDPAAALGLAEDAARLAADAGATGAEALARAYVGLYRLCLGQTEAGIAEQDHAAAMAMSTTIDPILGSTIYCAILWCCRSCADWTRAAEWCAGFETWCHAGLARLSGACELHRAELAGQRGTLAEARAHLEAAIAKLATAEPWSLGDAYRVLGDVQAMAGDLDAARAAYARAHAVGWDAEPGNALLLLEAGDAPAALAALDRAMAGGGWWQRQRRDWLAAHKALVAAAAGRGAEARALADRLEAQGRPLPAIRAITAEARARLALDAGEAAAAVRALQAARQLWSGLGAAYSAARLRLRLAELLAAGGDTPGTLAELAAAEAAARRIGARRLLAEARAMLARLTAADLSRVAS